MQLTCETKILRNKPSFLKDKVPIWPNFGQRPVFKFYEIFWGYDLAKIGWNTLNEAKFWEISPVFLRVR